MRLWVCALLAVHAEQVSITAHGMETDKIWTPGMLLGGGQLLASATYDYATSRRRRSPAPAPAPAPAPTPAPTEPPKTEEELAREKAEKEQKELQEKIATGLKVNQQGLEEANRDALAWKAMMDKQRTTLDGLDESFRKVKIAADTATVAQRAAEAAIRQEKVLAEHATRLEDEFKVGDERNVLIAQNSDAMTQFMDKLSKADDEQTASIAGFEEKLREMKEATFGAMKESALRREKLDAKLYADASKDDVKRVQEGLNAMETHDAEQGTPFENKLIEEEVKLAKEVKAHDKKVQEYEKRQGKLLGQLGLMKNAALSHATFLVGALTLGASLV